MNIHEYQAKELFRAQGLPVPNGRVAASVEEAVEAHKELGGKFPVVVKAQVHVGGRGKAGGVKLARNDEDLRAHAEAILGMSIKGITVKKVLIEEGVDIQREIYLGMVIDRASKGMTLMVSADGGVDIEEIAATSPERILRLNLSPTLGLGGHQVRQAAQFLDLPKDSHKLLGKVLKALETIFTSNDASLVEINPLVVTGSGDIIACDGKINFDDNALYRHAEVEALRDENEEDPLEAQARSQSISYVKLDGQIGCLVNGAGLAMATMDIVKYYGGEPANFLDVGGGANAERIAEALRIVTSDENVNTIFFNIFGGIVRCDRVAEGILKAKEQIGLDLPIVMRLVGTNQEKAYDLLADTDLIMLPTMAEAAQKAVELSKQGSEA